MLQARAPRGAAASLARPGSGQQTGPFAAEARPVRSAAGSFGRAPRRVAITGIGVVSPVGTGVADFWCGALAGASAVRQVTRFDASAFRSRIAAEVDGLDA